MTILAETDTGFTYTPCGWCGKNKATVVYKGWVVICSQCARIREIEEDE
jgi:hypothetical protein